MTAALLLLAIVPFACTSTAKPSQTVNASKSAVASPSATPSVSTAPATLPPTIAPTASPTLPPTPTPTITPASPSPTPDRTRTPHPSDSAPPPSGYPDGSMIVTFKVINEHYRVLVTSPENIEIAEALLAGEPAPSIPTGVVIRDETSVNKGWSWHIDPASLEFADVTTEVCDGKPSYVEDDIITSQYFCPWSAQVVGIRTANP